MCEINRGNAVWRIGNNTFSKDSPGTHVQNRVKGELTGSRSHERINSSLSDTFF
jgi:hypothetical protein